jgi:hypothetical protein
MLNGARKNLSNLVLNFVTYLWDTTLEVVSKPQIRLKSKAQTDEKAQHTRQYVSILKRFATQLLGLRWGFEATSRIASLQYPAITSAAPDIKNVPFQG